jgi:hypothetical protein
MAVQGRRRCELPVELPVHERADELVDRPVVLDGRDDAALGVTLALELVEERVRGDQAPEP